MPAAGCGWSRTSRSRAEPGPTRERTTAPQYAGRTSKRHRRCIDRPSPPRRPTMNTNTNNAPDDQVPAAVIMDIRHISTEQLAQLGMQQIAYVKPVVLNGEQGFAIHAADGTPMAVAGNRDVAIAAVMQHEMVAVQVH